MSLVDTQNPAGQVAASEGHARTGGKSIEVLAGQGIMVGEVSCEDSSESGTEAGSFGPDEDNSDSGDQDSRDQTITDFLVANPQIMAKILGEGVYSLENIMKQNASQVVDIIGKHFEIFAEQFAAQPKTINKLLDEEACLLHNFLQEHQEELNHYLKVKPYALAAYFEENPVELNRLMYKEPSLLSRFCDEHPSFMASWLQNRQATVQKYLVDNPALMWNHLRAHPAYRSGGQGWDREFTIGLVLTIPEEQEHLIREAIQWVLPKDRKRRMEKLAEMAARGESIVAVLGTAEGQEFIDKDVALEENDSLKLSPEETAYFQGSENVAKPERLKWYKGRNEYVERYGIRHECQALAVDTPARNTEIGPYQRAKSHIFNELHECQGLESQDAVGEESGDGESAVSDESDSLLESEDEHIDTEGDSSDHDDDRSPHHPSSPPHNDPDEDSDDQYQDRDPSETSSDTPLMVRSNRRREKAQENQTGENIDDDDDYIGNLEDCNSDGESDTHNVRRYHSGKKTLPGGKSYKGIKGVIPKFGGKNLPTQDTSEEAEPRDKQADENEVSESEHSTTSDIDSDDEFDQNMDDATAPAMIEYPAPLNLIEASKEEAPSSKWRLFEEDIAIGHMLNIRDEGSITGEARFRETRDRLESINGIRRTWFAVKNFWNRTGRARSGFDERKNKHAPLATSKQGKATEAKRAKTPVANSRASVVSPPALPSSATQSQPVPTASTTAPASKNLALSDVVITPETSPGITGHTRSTGNHSTGTSSTEPTFTLAEVDRMLAAHQADHRARLEADYAARHAESQEQFQAQLHAQLQAQKEATDNQIKAQTEMFQQAMAALTAASDRGERQQLYDEPMGHKRSRRELNDETDYDHTEGPAFKKRHLSPLNDNASALRSRGTASKSHPKWPFGRRGTPPRGYDYSSSQETQPGDRHRSERGHKVGLNSDHSYGSQSYWDRDQRDHKNIRHFVDFNSDRYYRPSSDRAHEYSRRSAPRYH